MAQNPEMLEIRKHHPDPRIANRLTWIARYRFAARQLVKEQKAEPPVKQAKEIFQAGVQTAKQAGDQEKIRQSVNAGSSKGKGRQVSADDQFISGLSRTSGTTGIPMSSMFRTK
jgi:hypothetical protein